MKKILKSTLIVALVIGALFTLTACGGKDEKKETKSTNPIVGSWKYEGVEYTYTFNEDGTGKYELGSTSMEFTYEIKDGNKLAITYTGSTAAFESTFEINGDTLNIKDSLGRDTIYKKVK